MRQKKIKIKLFILILLAIGCFFCFEIIELRAASNCIVINEIMLDRSGESKHEFIELYNNSDNNIDLSNYSLKKKTQSGSESNLVSKSKFMGIIPAHGFFLIAHPDYEDELGADLAYSGSSYSIAKNNTVILYNPEEAAIDKVGLGEAGDFEGSAVANPENDQSVERKELGIDTDNNLNDFILRNTPSPGSFKLIEDKICGDGEINQSSEECDDGNLEAGDGCDDACKIEDNGNQGAQTGTTTESAAAENIQSERRIVIFGTIVINEFVSDPADGELEWIELYNTRETDIDVGNWRIREGSGSETVLSGFIDKFLVVEKPKGNLNNKGDIIELRDQNNVIIDRVVYGDWDGGGIDNNAPCAGDPNSVARWFDGRNSYNNKYDFAITTAPTKGEANIIQNDVDDLVILGEAAEPFEPNKTCIFITEILPNPFGADQGNEFIELYNNCEADIDLSGWYFEDASAKQYKFTKFIIKPNQYISLNRAETKIALNNSEDILKLYTPSAKEPARAVEYAKAKEGCSYHLADITKNIWQWSERNTPGEENYILAINHPPLVDFNIPDKGYVFKEIIFDSSDTIDEDNDELNYYWDFGDGATNTLAMAGHYFSLPGIYSIKLIADDGKTEAQKIKDIQIINPNADLGIQVLDWNEEFKSANIKINELVPNPIGNDKGQEWIEIYNDSNAQVNLLNWQICDSSEKSFKFTDDLWIDSFGYLTLNQEETNLTLNNNREELMMYDTRGELIDLVSYEEAQEGKVYALGENNKWFWSSIATPQEKNIIKVSDDHIVSYALAGENNLSGQDKITSFEFNEINSLEIGQKAKVKGQVAVLPGVLGSQYFYITASSGVQIYNYKKDFPALSLGDLVEVEGEVSQSRGEKRIKTANKESIKIIGYQDAPKPKDELCENLSESNIGELISVSGEIVEKKGSSLYLDDGSGEVAVYIKSSTGISVKEISEGDLLSVSGIISQVDGNIRLLPRTSDDIIKKDQESGFDGMVLGEVAVNDEWSLAERDKKLELFQYLLIIAGAIIVLLFGLLIKEKQN